MEENRMMEQELSVEPVKNTPQTVFGQSAGPK